MYLLHYFNRSYDDQSNGIKLLDNLVDKLEDETTELKRLASETNRHIKELQMAVIQVSLDIFSTILNFLFLLTIFVDIGFT